MAEFTSQLEEVQASPADSALEGTVEVSLVWPEAGFDPEASGYYGFGVVVSFIHQSGIGYAPLAGSSRQGVAIWRQHSEITFVVVQSTAQRIGSVPQMPHCDIGPNFVLLHREVSAPCREYMPDGAGLMTVAQRCVYVAQVPVPLTDPIVIPNSAIKVDVPVQLDPANFSRLLVGYIPPPTGSSVGPITY